MLATRHAVSGVRQLDMSRNYGKVPNPKMYNRLELPNLPCKIRNNAGRRKIRRATTRKLESGDSRHGTVAGVNVAAFLASVTVTRHTSVYNVPRNGRTAIPRAVRVFQPLFPNWPARHEALY